MVVGSDTVAPTRFIVPLRLLALIVITSSLLTFIISSLGGVVAGAGGVTVGGAEIGDFVRSRTARKSTKLLFDEYNSLVERVKSEFANINPRLADLGKVETSFPGWVHFWGKLALGSAGAGKGIGWNVVAKTIIDSLKIASYTDDVARIGAGTSAAVFKTLSNAGKGLHIVGGILSIALMPWDIYTLVDSSINEHNKNPHKVSEVIRQHAKELGENFPTEDDIDKMINETINKVIEASINNKTNIIF